MCGIAGILRRAASASPPSREELVAMVGAMAYRGPDEFGLYLHGRCGMSHARLSIVDLATGQQPLSNEDGTLWVVFNGEIFDHVEIRAELEALGHRFRTRSDTEVIVHAYEAWGDDAFRRFNGQWAIALFDEREQKLVLARDRLGVRPLHVAEHGGSVYFASEAKAIYAAAPGLTRALDPLGLDEVFTFWAPVAPRTVLAGITELEPGHVRTYHRDGRVDERAYDPLVFPDRETGEGLFRGSEEDAVHAVREALREATRLRMVRADVPVGCYLSGGLDSSVVAALGREFAGDRFHTFSIRFADAEYDESEHQDRMVAHLGSEHHAITVTRRDVADVLPAVIAHAEKPILRTGPAPLFLLSKLVRDTGVKVVLTGEGADEMFAGYDLFREGKVRRFWARHPGSALRPRLLDRLYPYLARSPVAQRAMARKFFGKDLERANEPGFAHGLRFGSAQALTRLFSATMRDSVASTNALEGLLAGLPPELARWSPLSQDEFIERRTLLAGYLLSSQGDRVLMAHSVEGRFPYLDRDVVRLADSLPDSMKLRVLEEKHILRRAAEGLLPDSVRKRQKQPYRAPDALAFASADRPAYVDEMLSPAVTARVGVFEPDLVDKLRQKCIAQAEKGQLSNADNMALVGVLSTHLLHDALVERAPAVRNVELRTVVDRLSSSVDGEPASSAS